MNFRHFIAAAAVAALPFSATAATFVIPAVGTGAGAAGSKWQSDVTLHNASPRVIGVTLTLQGIDVTLTDDSADLTLQPRETRTIADVVKSEFGLDSAVGALVITTSDRDARGLAITSRTSNVTATSVYGQDIPAISTLNAAVTGDIAALNGPAAIANDRFNFGLYSVDAASVRWELVRANGTIADSQTVNYPAGDHVQYNSGVVSLFGATAENGDTVYARVLSGRILAYGSIVNATGDPSFVPAVRTRDDITIQFAGLDLDENGTVDVLDANGDGVLDRAIEIVTSLYPEYFRVVAAGEFGETVTYQIVSTPAAAAFLDASGTMRVAPFGDVKGTTGEIVVKASSGTSETLLTIPVIFR
jgi:hypothetical protein